MVEPGLILCLTASASAPSKRRTPPQRAPMLMTPAMACARRDWRAHLEPHMRHRSPRTRSVLHANSAPHFRQPTAITTRLPPSSTQTSLGPPSDFLIQVLSPESAVPPAKRSQPASVVRRSPISSCPDARTAVALESGTRRWLSCKSQRGSPRLLLRGSWRPI